MLYNRNIFVQSKVHTEGASNIFVQSKVHTDKGDIYNRNILYRARSTLIRVIYNSNIFEHSKGHTDESDI